jgi:hypothetical protein
MVFNTALESIGYKKPWTVNQITNVNTEQKKKPYDISINNKAKQPTVTPNVKYTDKQRFRRYKTKKEPEMLKKVEVNQDDDIVEKLRAALDPMYKKPNTNFSQQITAPAAYNKGTESFPEVSTYYPPVGGRPRTIYDGLTQQELSEKINEVTFTDKEREEFTDILSKNGLDAPKEGNEEKAREVFTDYLLARDVLLREIDDVSTEDAEALIFKPTGLSRQDEEFLSSLEPIDLLKPLIEDDKKNPFFDDGEVVARPLNTKESMAEEAAKLLQSNIKKRLQKKDNKEIIKGYEYGKRLSKMSDDLNLGRRVTLDPIIRGNNRVIGLQIHPSTEEKERQYSAGLDKVLPTPKKLDFTQRKGVKETGTGTRSAGRPSSRSYREANPSRFVSTP